ncbi:MAG: hypothetical protein IJE48_02120 [Clostridia bacterium]|nr:hypothetical protein [Clostridia bacterium]
MKKLIKIIAVTLIAVFALSALMPATVSAGGKLNYVVLGDSIGFGAGVVNPGEACYGRIVADTNGYNYSNHSMCGYNTAAYLLHMQLPNVRSSIKKADIISLSIGGNDFLTSNMAQLGFEAAVLDDLSTFDKIAETFYKNFCKIISEIRELNPDAVILVQTLYNPMNNAITDFYQQGVDRLNAGYRRYQSENPGSIHIVDVGGAFKGHPEYIANDCVHPNAQGNVVIAQLVLRKLSSLGLGTAVTPVINNAGVNNRFTKPFKEFVYMVVDIAEALFPDLFVI